jgi:hydrogenase-4 membrane subunit HyfE
MTGILIGFQLVLLVPLFVGTWRTSLLGLAAQGALMAWLALRHGTHFGLEALLDVLDFVVLRALFGPVSLYRELASQNAPRRNDAIAPNLLSWAMAVGLVFVAFRLANVLSRGDEEHEMLLATATAGLLLGFLVLASRRGLFSQIIGVLRIENAVALFALGGGEPLAPPLRLAEMALLLVTYVYLRRFLVDPQLEEHASDEARETPSL